MFKREFAVLARLYWQLRACRRSSRPSAATWYRRIRAERARLFGLGVPYIELHLVCRVLRNPNNQRTARMLDRYYEGLIVTATNKFAQSSEEACYDSSSTSHNRLFCQDEGAARLST